MKRETVREVILNLTAKAEAEGNMDDETLGYVFFCENSEGVVHVWTEIMAVSPFDCLTMARVFSERTADMLKASQTSELVGSHEYDDHGEPLEGDDG